MLIQADLKLEFKHADIGRGKQERRCMELSPLCLALPFYRAPSCTKIDLLEHTNGEIVGT